MQFIERPRSVLWRQVVFQVHLWTGVVIGLYVIVISVTGSAIVFSDRITNDVPAGGAGPIASRALSLDSLATIARSQRQRFRTPLEITNDSTSGIYRFRMSDETGATQYVYVKPDGTVVKTVSGAAPRHAVIDFLSGLHTDLLGGHAGSVANGIGGIALAVLAATGIVVWWPGRTSWRRALAIKPGAGPKRLVFDIHAAGGFWTMLFVWTFALTGAALAFFGTWTHFVAALMPTTTSAPSPVSTWHVGDPTAPLARLVRDAASLEPALRWDLVEIGARSGDTTIVRLAKPGVPLRVSQHAFVYFDPGNGAVLEDWRSRNRTFGDLVTWYVVEGLHYGDYSVATQCAWVLIGLTPAALAVSSIILWWMRLQRWRVRFVKRRRAHISS